MQFGRALNRATEKVVKADLRYGPIHLAKIDIADGFYRVWLQIADIPKLGVVLPTSSGQPALVNATDTQHGTQAGGSGSHNPPP